MVALTRVAAVLLAGGSSERFGRENKLMADVGGEPLLRRVACSAIEAHLSEVVVVTGYEADRYRDALGTLPFRYVHNAAWVEGIGSSIAAGVRALGDGVDGAFIVPADMPYLTSSLFTRLRAAFDASGGSAIVVPVTEAGKQRNPVLWPRGYFPELRSLFGANGAKALLRTHAEHTHAVPLDADIQGADIDTVADLAAVRGGPLAI